MQFFSLHLFLLGISVLHAEKLPNRISSFKSNDRNSNEFSQQSNENGNEVFIFFGQEGPEGRLSLLEDGFVVEKGAPTSLSPTSQGGFNRGQNRLAPTDHAGLLPFSQPTQNTHAPTGVSPFSQISTLQTQNELFNDVPNSDYEGEDEGFGFDENRNTNFDHSGENIFIQNERPGSLFSNGQGQSNSFGGSQNHGPQRHSNENSNFLFMSKDTFNQLRATSKDRQMPLQNLLNDREFMTSFIQNNQVSSRFDKISPHSTAQHQDNPTLNNDHRSLQQTVERNGPVLNNLSQIQNTHRNHQTNLPVNKSPVHHEFEDHSRQPQIENFNREPNHRANINIHHHQQQNNDNVPTNYGFPNESREKNTQGINGVNNFPPGINNNEFDGHSRQQHGNHPSNDRQRFPGQEKEFNSHQNDFNGNQSQFEQNAETGQSANRLELKNAVLLNSEDARQGALGLTIAEVLAKITKKQNNNAIEQTEHGNEFLNGNNFGNEEFSHAHNSNQQLGSNSGYGTNQNNRNQHHDDDLTNNRRPSHNTDLSDGLHRNDERNFPNSRQSNSRKIGSNQNRNQLNVHTHENREIFDSGNHFGSTVGTPIPSGFGQTEDYSASQNRKEQIWTPENLFLQDIMNMKASPRGRRPKW